MSESSKWFRISADHLDEAHNCFQRERYGYALFWLQQANEILAKGLLEFLRLMDPGRSEAWITSLKEVGLNIQLPGAKEYGHPYGEKFFSAIEKNLANFESDLLKAFESSKLTALGEKRADIIDGYERQFKDWSEKLNRAREAYRSTSTATDFSKITHSCGRLLTLIVDLPTTETGLSDLSEELAGSTLLVSAVEDLAHRAGVRLVPSLITSYFKLLKGMMLLLVVLILGRNLAPYEASVRYPEGHFQDHSGNIVVRNFNEVVALHKKCLAIAQKIVE